MILQSSGCTAGPMTADIPNLTKDTCNLNQKLHRRVPTSFSTEVYTKTTKTST